jgi:AraC-like DNA-binding protein
VEQLDDLLDYGRPPLADIARRCELSVSHFSRAFTRSTGLSPTRWSKRRRMERAKLLLRSTTCSLTDISQACGFTDQSHFGHQFSVATGTTPARWREQYHDDRGRIP